MAFEGTWEATKFLGECEGFADMCKALKTEQSLIDAYSKVSMGTKYALDKATGKWSISVLVNGENKKTTEVELGKEFETQGLDGKKYKCVINMNGDEIEETAVPTDGAHKGTKTNKSISGSTMTVKTVITGNESTGMSYTMTKK